MLVAAVGFYFNNVWGCSPSFMMGAQSAFSAGEGCIIPQHLHKDQLVGATLWWSPVPCGHFVGHPGAGMLSKQEKCPSLFSGVVVVLAVLGWFASRQIPIATAPSPEIRIRFNPSPKP